MSHLDPDLLALIALGEPVASDEERAHLAACRECAAEAAEMTRAVVVARSTMDEMPLDAPPPSVWDRIVDELALSSEVAANPLDAAPATPSVVASPETPTDAAPSATASTSPPTRRADRTPRRSLRVMWALAASIVLVLVVGAGVWVGFSGLAATPIATAALEPFPAHPEAAGTAEVEQSRDGTRTLKVTLHGEADADDYREVWLIRGDGSALISMGVLEGASGSFPIPDGVDLAEYDLVDISFEPIDGDPAHSGDSIVRGQLAFA